MTSPKQTMKNVARHVLAVAYQLSGTYKTLHKGKVLILMYHRVLSQRELEQQYVQPGMYVHKDVFAKQMQFLQKNFQIISFADLLLAWKQGGLREDQRYCVITFDDGWLDNYLYAYPILRKYNIPATIFLATAFIGTDLWLWPEKIGQLLKQYSATNFTINDKRLIDPLRKKYPWLDSIAGNNKNQRIDSVIELCKALPDKEIHTIIEALQSISGSQLAGERMFLNWEEILEMSKNGLSFGSHSCTHRILTKYSSETIREELIDSYRELSSREIDFVPLFCYPNGDYNSEIAEQVKNAGYQAAVTTRAGFEGIPGQHLFDLHRISIHNDISWSLPLFQFHISGLDRIPPSRKNHQL